MPSITLPDGTRRRYREATTVRHVAEDIGPGLGRAALAGMVDGQLVDTSHTLHDDAELRIITSRDPEGLAVLRHSCAHLMAQAVKQLYPQAQVTIGPVIEDGFYYDYAFHRPFTPEDLAAIEQRMKALARADLPVQRQLMDRQQAVALFRGMGEQYKAEIIAGLPGDEQVSLYTQGDFTDLCRGPHVPSTGHLRAFKLTRLAAAYWRGDASQASLQRIYGTAWPDRKSLDDYLARLAEAERRDHRRLGRKLQLFHFQPEAPGMVFWHARGWTLYCLIEQHVRLLMRQHGYQEIRTPMLLDRSLWQRSGHWDKFREDMFSTQAEQRDYAIKPMNCPGHVQVFNQGLKSYRDLPLRLAEFGSCHRNEPSGALHGLMRARHFVQDDAHIFCTEAQIQAEVSAFIDMLYRVYADFGFTDIQLSLSTRPARRVGDDQVWDKAEQALREALGQRPEPWTLQEGEGAFYGPKIEFSLRDCLGRVWQCGTMQVDFSMPERLGAHYIAEDGSKQTPVMLHRAILGSLERFVGILLEHYAGQLPVWLAPVQAVLLPISEHQQDYAEGLRERLLAAGLRVEADLRNETISRKIREHTLQGVPWLLIAGAREAKAGTLALRSRQGEDLGAIAVPAVIERLLEEQRVVNVAELRSKA